MTEQPLEPGCGYATIAPMRSANPTAPPAALPVSVVHGGAPEGPQSAEARVAEEDALGLLDDAELARLLTAPRERRETDRARGVFVNRNLRMAERRAGRLRHGLHAGHLPPAPHRAARRST